MSKDVFPLGFHAGATGHYPADLIKEVNRRGLKAFVKVIDDDGRAEEALRIGDTFGIENVVVFRLSNQRVGAEVEAPDGVFGLNKPMEQSADEWWSRHHNEFQKINAARARNNSAPLDKRIWFEIGNETNRNTYRQQGEMYAIIAKKHAIPGGWRICAPGSNSGEPNGPGMWFNPEQPQEAQESWAGWEEYFRLCALHPDKVAMALHYYEWSMGEPHFNDKRFVDSTPFLVGREAMIYEICDRENIDYPVIHITEGGFKHDTLPGWNPQVDEWIEGLMKHMGEQPNMTGIGWWCAQVYQGNVHHMFKNEFVPKFKEKARNWVAPPQLARGDRPDPVVIGNTGGTGSSSGGTGSGNSGSGASGSGGNASSGGNQAAVATNKGTGALSGLEALAFGLGHEGHNNSYKVNSLIWFHFKIQNNSSNAIQYGGIGALAWRWDNDARSWSKFRWQNSWGGNQDKINGNKDLSAGDNIKLTEQGIFALTLAMTSDENARNKTGRPDDIQDLQIMREPVYINVGPHFANGSVLSEAPQPLFVVEDTGGSSNAGSGTGSGSGAGTSGGGTSSGTGSAGGGTGNPWKVSRQQALYLLAPQSLSVNERKRLYEMAWDGVSLPAGGRTSGKHTVTFSHDDAFNNVANGAAGSMVIIAEPQRIGSGITPEWMAQNAANITYLLTRLDGVGFSFGLGTGSSGKGTTGSGISPQEEFLDAWIWNSGLSIDDSTTPATVTLGKWLNIRPGPGKADFPQILGELVVGDTVTKRGEVENAYMPVRILRSKIKPEGTEAARAQSGNGKTGAGASTISPPRGTPGKYHGPKVTFADGIHGPGDAHTWHDQGFVNMIRHLNMPVKFMSDSDRSDSFPKFNKAELSLVRVFWKPDFDRRKTAQLAWDEDIRDGVKRFYDRGARNFEVLNEPRLHHEGMDHQWHNGEEFGDFLFDLMKIIKRECPEARLWYPGESPGVPWSNQFAFSRPAFRKVSSLLYGICMHAYSGVTNDAERAANEITNQAKAFHVAMANHDVRSDAWRMPIIISECSVNRAPRNAGDEFAEYRADVYKRVTEKLRNVPGIQGVFWYISHWRAPDNEVANQESWYGTSIADKYKQKMGR